nr:MAG TPA: hypothetical protein [Caudoviricetes sp.]
MAKNQGFLFLLRKPLKLENSNITLTEKDFLKI